MLARTSHHSIHLAATPWRLTMVLVVMTALIFNLVSGSYSGVVHAHDHDHVASDHHKNDHAADHAYDHGDAGTETESMTFAGDGSTKLDQSHEHPTDLVLSLADQIYCSYCDSQPSRAPPRTAAVVLHDFEPSERPPRVA